MMKWEKPKLIDLAMATFGQTCAVGNAIMMDACGPVGSSAAAQCGDGSGVTFVADPDKYCVTGTNGNAAP